LRADPPLLPEQVIPRPVAEALAGPTTWFLIGGQAVRCLVPYRSSRDVDLGVGTTADLDEILDRLARVGTFELVERSADTAHVLVEGLEVSVFVLERLAPFAQGGRLGVTGLLATKLHAILDRGLRRDFFDLYVLLQHERLGVAAAIDALREVYRQPVRDELLLRALCYFDDAEREERLPGEGDRDFQTVRRFFLKQVGQLLVPPTAALEIQSQRVDVR